MKINKKIFDNGLRLVHNEDTSTQMVALNIVYDVGARDEHPEHTGFAHLFEHLMFGGSVHIPDYDAPLQLAGGENNAWTNNDITNYYLTVPKSNVEIGFWLESDRMLELAFSEQSLEVQRAVVMEEFKQRCLNQPYGDVGHLLRPLAYQTHPYRWPTIGKDLSHIANATLDEVKEFFFRFYAPNNAVLAVTGNISWEETVRLTEKWFAPIPRRNVPVRQLPQEVVQTAERRQTVERNVPLDALFMAYHMCSREDADYYAFDILFVCLWVEGIIHNWATAVLASILALSLFSIKVIVYRRAAKILRKPRLFFSLPLFSFIQPCINLYFKTIGSVTRKKNFTWR